MKARVAIFLTSIALFAAIGCAPGAGAESPESPGEATGSPDPSFTAAPLPTSTPWPRFGPPPVTAASITATVQAAPFAPPETPVPAVTATPTALPGGEKPVVEKPPAPTVSPAPTPAATALDASGTFEPILFYEYLLLADWEEVVGDDELVLLHPSGKARISLREREIDRSSIESITDVARSMAPLSFVDWSERSLAESRATGGNSYRLEYVGTKLGESQIAVVDWYLWGELLVEVVIEADGSAWPLDSNIRNTSLLVASSLSPDTEFPIVSKVDVDSQVRVRFGHRLSKIYTTYSDGVTRSQFTCREVLVNLLSDPVYLGSGVWQMFAVTEQGVQVWEVYEPTLNIVPAAHNTSIC